MLTNSRPLLWHKQIYNFWDKNLWRLVPMVTTTIQIQKYSDTNQLSDRNTKTSAYRRQKKSRIEHVPWLRGKVHFGLFLFSPFWIAHLRGQNTAPAAQLTVLVVIICSLLNFSSSAALHSFQWKKAKHERWCRRIDHACIFLMVAGSCSPGPILLFPKTTATLWAITQTVSAAAGIGLCVISKHFAGTPKGRCRNRTIVYIIQGLLNICFIREFRKHYQPVEILCLLGMCSSYIVGAIIYSCRKPDPLPKIIGYHEIFHIMCLLGAVLAYILNCLVLSRV